MFHSRKYVAQHLPDYERSSAVAYWEYFCALVAFNNAAMGRVCFLEEDVLIDSTRLVSDLSTF